MSTELAVPTQLLDVRTGEVLPATPDDAAQLLRGLREHRTLLAEAIRLCEAVIAEEGARQGTKTLTLGDVSVEIYGGDAVEWDIDRLLQALADAGCPAERIAALVRTEVVYKVDRRVEKQLAGSNPKYAAVIEAAKTVVPAPTRVRVKQA